jgi:actin related protein 2/3 complex subunit 4
MLKHKLVDFIIQFMEEVDKEISEMKLFVSLHGPRGGSRVILITRIAECASKICGGVVLDTCEYFSSPSL